MRQEHYLYLVAMGFLTAATLFIEHGDYLIVITLAFVGLAVAAFGYRIEARHDR